MDIFLGHCVVKRYCICYLVVYRVAVDGSVLYWYCCNGHLSEMGKILRPKYL